MDVQALRLGAEAPVQARREDLADVAADLSDALRTT